MTLRIGHLSTFYHTAMLLMAAADTEERMGTAVRWDLHGTGPSLVNAFERGELDLAYIGLPPAMIGMSRAAHREPDLEIVCISGGHMEGTAAACAPGVSTSEDATERVLESFAGRTLGVPGKGSIHDVILGDALERLGLRERVKVINFPWADLILDAMKRGEVQGCFGTPALAAAVEYYLGGRVMIEPRSLWPANPSYGICTTRRALNEKPGVLRSFLRLHEEASERLRLHPRQAAQDIARFVGFVPEALVERTIGLSPRYCAKLSEPYIAASMRFVPVLRSLNYMRDELQEGRVFHRALIDEVHPQQDHYQGRSS